MDNPRVRAHTSDRVVGVKNDDLFAQTGSREPRSMAGRGAKPHKTAESCHFYPQKEAEVVCGGKEALCEAHGACGACVISDGWEGWMRVLQTRKGRHHGLL